MSRDKFTDQRKAALVGKEDKLAGHSITDLL
jgi:hypothetical protein